VRNTRDLFKWASLLSIGICAPIPPSHLPCHDGSRGFGLFLVGGHEHDDACAGNDEHDAEPNNHDAPGRRYAGVCR
jgi:hypothetical protein